MARVCDLTGKRPMIGHNVSHSNRKTKRKFLPNLRNKRFYVPELDQWIELRVAASTIRTINKKGIYQYLKELEKKAAL
ncbi:MAG: 50S ribosomal protein L28 [Chitinophagales bacterium]|nr:50S ribosomal protein L28 [Chitinophagales bacterium]